MASALLPSTWLNEFRAAALPTPGPAGSSRTTSGTAIQYTCKKCPGEPCFSMKHDAKRHAQGKKHRALFQTGAPARPQVARKASNMTGTSQGLQQQMLVEPLLPQVPQSPESWHLPSSPDYSRHSSPFPTAAPDPSRTTRTTPNTYLTEAGLGWDPVDDNEWEGCQDEARAPDGWPISGAVDYDLPDSEDALESESEDESDWSSSVSECGSECGSDSSISTSLNEGLEEVSDFLKTFVERAHGPQRPWDPYPNATYAILDIITNFPRHPVSDELLRIILWGLTSLGVKDVPSLSVFHEFQGALRKSDTFAKARPCVSVLGNRFTTNDVLKSIALDMSNPLVREHIAFYPEDTTNGTSELRHSSKWLWDLPDCKLTPMWASPEGKHFYIQELARERNGRLVVPLRWFIRSGEMFMVYFPVYITESGLEVDRSTRLQGPARVLDAPLPEILAGCRASGSELRIAELSRSQCDPSIENPWRARAGGRPCYKYFILFGGDDVSGNRSKSWNKHNCFYYCAAGLPLECLNQEYFVHFISSSQFAGPLEQVAAIAERLRSVQETGLVCFDCTASKQDNPTQECLVIPDLFVGTGDGPWQSELSSHSGDGCPCRFCKVGGTVKERSSDQGFLALMETGHPRTPSDTLQQIRQDLNTATFARQGTTLANTQQSTGIVDNLAQTVIDSLVQRGKDLFEQRLDDGRKEFTNAQIHELLVEERDATLGKGDFFNCLLVDEVFDPHQDTALGRLHLVLLGFAKYFWSASLPATGRKLTNAEKEALDLAEAILVSLSQDGLGDRAVRADYVMRYRGSLVGRHLHSITQLAVFIFGRTVSTELRMVWVALSRLCAMLFTQTIKDLDGFVKDLQVVIDDFFDAVVQFNPTWVMYKSKFHHLPHAPKFIKRFGPMGLYAEDRFEKFHGVWRNSSVFSNHHSASRDSATHFNAVDATKHILSGGYFAWGGSMVRAGPAVLKLFKDQPTIRDRFGLRKPTQREIGHVRVARKASCLPWDSLGALTDRGLEEVWPLDSRVPHHEFYISAKAVVSMRGDICKPGMFVWCVKPQPCVARIHTIFSRERTLSSGRGPDAMVRVELFSMTHRHVDIECPCLRKGDTYLVLPKDILFTVNVQHDCFKHSCQVTGTTAKVQERERTTHRTRIVKHLDDTDYILNIFVLHHYDELIQLLPPEFVGPAHERSEEEHKTIRLAAAEVLRRQIKAREASKGAVRQARASAKPPASKGSGRRGKATEVRDDDVPSLIADNNTGFGGVGGPDAQKDVVDEVGRGARDRDKQRKGLPAPRPQKKRRTNEVDEDVASDGPDVGGGRT